MGTPIRPDDEVYQVHAVWLGPRGFTFPWTARYQAYAVWLVVFGVILLIERVTPLSVGIPPVWETTLSTLATYAGMGAVSQERPIGSSWRTLMAELTAPRTSRPEAVTVTARVQARRGDSDGHR